MKRVWALLLSFVMMTAAVGCRDGASSAPEETPLPVTGELKAAFLKVGKADAIVITTATKTMVVDTGESDDGGKVLEYLQDEGVEAVDYLVITHFDRDHVGGAERILYNIPVKQAIHPDYVGVREEYQAYIDTLAALEIPTTAMSAASGNLVFMLDDVQVTINPPQKAVYEKEPDNDQSLVMRLRHGSQSLLLAGDATAERLGELANSGITLRSDLLKIPHHGVYDDASAALIKTVAPAYAVTCDSDKNPLEDKVAALLTQYKVQSYETKDGDVLCVSDGSKLTVTQ